MRGYNFFSNDGDPWSVTLSNLNNGTYSLYYYAPTNTIVSTGGFTANGLLASNISGNSTSTLNEGSDWEVLTGVRVTNGTLTLVSVSTVGARGLAGIQLVEAPEPSALLLIGASLGAGLLVRRETRRGGGLSGWLNAVFGKHPARE